MTKVAIDDLSVDDAAFYGALGIGDWQYRPSEEDIGADKSSFIGAWNINDDDLCDDLIQHINSSSKTQSGMIGSQDGLRVYADRKKSTDLILEPNLKITERYIKALHGVLTRYKIKYPHSDGVSSYSIESLQVQKYKQGEGFFEWHTERCALGNVFRHLVFMTYLNDVEDGGETEFFYQNLKVKPRKGLTLIWPVDWTHTHRGITSATEEKYITTGWYDYDH
jgi:prolyl 4-hydroxylase